MALRLNNNLPWTRSLSLSLSAPRRYKGNPGSGSTDVGTWAQAQAQTPEDPRRACPCPRPQTAAVREPGAERRAGRASTGNPASHVRGCSGHCAGADTLSAARRAPAAGSTPGGQRAARARAGGRGLRHPTPDVTGRCVVTAGLPSAAVPDAGGTAAGRGVRGSRDRRLRERGRRRGRPGSPLPPLLRPPAAPARGFLLSCSAPRGPQCCSGEKYRGAERSTEGR
jgi:hypothetical protein